ncbi:PBP1A family penicillin-binding protein [Paralimibaculum aggregatum]|uniref:Penicillin-binding protein 1A n=1 Tax=Paralimibaculum aggregatum TaxID=3036245 RepID=A0ABQ6LS18_9RHOB|nr:PBP1A family penicillin-binding protein [Limibaculum sp. NKW23]GMG84441.1 PBP1A family penicillin-binding protein [Limibaculum sp. NKW23]
MIRLVANLFSNAAIAAVFALVAAAAVVRMYGADLPRHDELVNYQPPMLSRVYNGEGAVIAEYATERRVFAPIEEIPPLVRNAFISAEDKNYYEHPGVDAVGIAKALVRYGVAKAAGRPARLAGASTITQQVMKNFLLDSDREIERKIKEMILAVRLDGALSKDHILELYLNEIFFGARAYGVASAARIYFGKTLEELRPEEVAYLAALPKAPSRLHPVRDRERAIERRDYVLEEMAQNGHLSRAEAEAAKAAPLETILEEDVPDPLAPEAPSYFTHEVRRQVIREMDRDALYEGGLTIRATIDPALQEFAAEALRAALEAFDRDRGVWRGANGRVEAVAEGTTDGWAAALAGAKVARDIPGWYPAVVLASDAEGARLGIAAGETAVEGRITLAGNRWIRRVGPRGAESSAPRPDRADALWKPGDILYVSREENGWALRQIPEIQGAFMAMDPHTGRVLAIQGGFSYEYSRFNRATQAKRQPGSSFKPFVYAAALDAGYAPSTIVLDAPVVVRLGGRTWRPKNSSGGFYGPTPLANGIVYSRNLMTVRIAQSVGMDRVAEYAERFGVYNDMPHHLSYALGAGETTLYDMVAAYGMFANGGRRVRPTVIDRIQNRNGSTLFRHDPRSCQGCGVERYRPEAEPILFDTRDQIMNPYTASELVKMMRGVVERGTASRTVGGLGFPVAGKTGTTNESKDAWFIGFAPNLVAGCYIGYDQPRPMGRGAYGGTLCGPVFKAFMRKAAEVRAPGRFEGPDFGETVTVKLDAETGARLPDDAEGPNVITQTFRTGAEPELFDTVQALVDDESLFGGLAEPLPYEIGADPELPYETSPSARAARGGGGGVGQGAGTQGQAGGAPRPPRPQPPSDVGLGTGGLY